MPIVAIRTTPITRITTAISGEAGSPDVLAPGLQCEKTIEVNVNLNETTSLYPMVNVEMNTL